MLTGPPRDRTLVDVAARDLREAILEGDLAPGSPLVLRDLAERAELSVMPIREALARLSLEGLVDQVPHRGARVAPLSNADLDDLYGLRIAIESAAVRRAAGRMTDERYRSLSLLLASYVPPAAGEDTDARNLHRAFHFGLYEASGSRWLTRILPQLWDSSERYRRIAIRRRGSPECRWHEHAEILEAVRQNDAGAASELLTAHLSATMRMIESVLIAGAGECDPGVSL